MIFVSLAFHGVKRVDWRGNWLHHMESDTSHPECKVNSYKTFLFKTEISNTREPRMDSATHSRVRLTDFQVYHEFADVWQRNRVRQIASSSIVTVHSGVEDHEPGCLLSEVTFEINATIDLTNYRYFVKLALVRLGPS